MQYRLIIDKQPMDNPSSERREYKIDIEELRYKGKIHDSLIIKMNKAHVVRRLALTKNHVLKVLLEPIKEPLEDINIELFEDNNYIYLIDMIGNAFYVEYLNKTGFNDIFATRTEMRGAIEVTSREIELSVDKKFTNYLTAEETKAMIKLEADSIKLDVKNIKEEAIKNVDVMYALSNSETTAPATGWSTNAPQWEQGKYMWQKTVTTLADDTIKESEPTCISGAKGDKGEQGVQGLQGEKGEQGIAGKDGISGKTSYFHIKYSSIANPATSSEMSEIPNTYIGTYVDFTEEDSTDPSKYTWTRFQGLQGAKGEQGIPGTNGVNGTSYYLHIKYSNDGQTFTSNNGETVGDYIGVRTDTNVNDSTNFSDYKWSKIKGNGAKKFVEQYYLSTSNTTQTGGTWKTAEVKWEENKYIWTRTQITWTDDTVTYTDPVLATNINGLSETTAKIEEKANLIDLEVKKKVSSEDVTAAKIMMMINDDESEIQISGDKVDIDGKAVHFKTDISTTLGPFTESDFNKIKDYIMEVGTLTPEEFEKYDINKDGKINSLETYLVRNAINNGGYLTFSGTFEINPYSSSRSIAIYNNRTKKYDAILSLMDNYFSNIDCDGLKVKGSFVVQDDNEESKIIVGTWDDVFCLYLYGLLWCEDKIYSCGEEVLVKPTTLYSNTSGTTGTVSLSESATNFEHIEIFFKDNYGANNSVDVDSPNGKNALLSTLQCFNADLVTMGRTRTVNISGTSITTNTYGSYNSWNNSTEANNQIFITKVIGYR